MPLSVQNIPLQTIRQQLRRYVARLWWIGRDALRNFKARMIAVTALNLIEVASGAAMLGGIVLFAKYVETGEAPSVRGIRIPLSDETSRLLIFAAILAALGLISAVSSYATQWLIGEILNDYYRHCIKRLLAIVADPAYRGWQSLVNGPPLKAIMQLTGEICRLMSIVLRYLLQATFPVAMFIVAVVTLVVMDPLLTAMLLPLVALYTIPFYLINRSVARQQRQFIRLNRDVRQAFRENLRQIIGSSAAPQQKQEWADASLRGEDWLQLDDLFSRRKLADDRMHLLNAAFFVLCLLGLFAFYAMREPADGRTWAGLLLYLMALRYAVSGLRQLTSMLVDVSRYVPQLHQYFDFVDAAQQLRARRRALPDSFAPLPDELVFEFGNGSAMRRWNSAARLRVRRGQALWILIAWKPMHGDLEAVAAHLESRVQPRIDLLHTAQFFAGDECESKTDAAEFESHEFGSQVMQPVSDIQRALAGAPQSSRQARVALVDAPAPPAARLSKFDEPIRPGPVTFLTAAALTQLDGKLETGGEIKSSSYVFVLSHQPGEVSRGCAPDMTQNFAGVVVMRNSDIIACGDLSWLKQHHQSITDFLRCGEDDNREDQIELDEL